MPRAALKPCRGSQCPELVASGLCPECAKRRESARIPCLWVGCPGYAAQGGRGYCAGCARARERDRGTSTQRGYGGKWRKVSERVRREQPVCRVCATRPSVHVDHIIPKTQGGDDDRSNLQGICFPCHQAKTRRESNKHRRG